MIRSHLYRAMIAAACTIMAFPFAARAEVPSGSLVKGETSSSVYYVEAGKRYAFPNERVFFSWYTDFRSVITVPDTELAGWALAGNVTYRPGSRLVKVTTDPRVYAVSRFGVLRWVANEAAAAGLYGPNWNTKVDDVADTFFINYMIGADISSVAHYSVNEESGVSTIASNIRPNGYIAPALPTVPETPSTQKPTISVVVSTSQATRNQIVTVFATVDGSAKPMSKVEMYESGQLAPIATCQNTLNCSANYTVQQAPLNARFYAVATDAAGARYETDLESQGTLTVPAVVTDIITSVSPSSIAAGDRSSFSSDASAYANLSSHKVFAVIPGEPNPILWKDCGISTICAGTTPFYRLTQIYSQVKVNGDTYLSASVNVAITNGEPPKPKLTITGKPNLSQAVLQLDAPSGETIGWSTIVAGTSQDNDALALCEFSSCEITVQVNKTTTFTGFTNVGGKLEASNSVVVEF